jgi:hypothetical protein
MVAVVTFLLSAQASSLVTAQLAQPLPEPGTDLVGPRSPIPLPPVAPDAGRAVPARTTVASPPPSDVAGYDVVRTTDGRVHVGRIVGEIPAGTVFEPRTGGRTVLPLSLILEIKRGVKDPAPAALADSLTPYRRSLSIAFDAHRLETEREALTYGEKLFLLVSGAALTVAGVVSSGGTGKVVRNLGIAEMALGGTLLTATIVRRHRLQSRVDELRANLEAAPPSQASAASTGVALVSGEF